MDGVNASGEVHRSLRFFRGFHGGLDRLGIIGAPIALGAEIANVQIGHKESFLSVGEKLLIALINTGRRFASDIFV